MSDVVNVNLKEDDSVQKVIEQTAQKLQNKYKKKRDVKESLLYKKTKWYKAISITLNVLCLIVVILSAMIFFSIINCKAQNVAPSFAGFSSMKIASGSMKDSGFEVGDVVVARSVDTKTLKAGDIIAYYHYSVSENEFTTNGLKNITEQSKEFNTKYSLSFAKFFGVQPAEIQEAAHAGSSIIFHEIINVYEAVDGTRWFQTKGSSNENADAWYVSEEMVIGVYDNSGFANMFGSIIGAFSSSAASVFIILIPLLIMGVLIMLEFLRDIQILKLQLDVIEEKRKITDPICVKNEVGYHMDLKSKYKVLAQADDKDKNEYIALLWKDGTAPQNIRKYCLRKKMYLKPVEKLLEINRVCEEKIKKGEDPLLVAEYYIKEKEKLQKDQLEYERQFRSWMKVDKEDSKKIKAQERQERKEAKEQSQAEVNQQEEKKEETQVKTDDKEENKSSKAFPDEVLKVEEQKQVEAESNSTNDSKQEEKTTKKKTKKTDK